MKFSVTVLSLTAIATPSLGAWLMPRQDDIQILQLCPNPNGRPLPDVQCMNFTSPITPLHYGATSCTTLDGTPLEVGPPQGVSSAYMFGSPLMNCTLYKSNDCQEPGFEIPQQGADALAPDFDDQTVAFQCVPLSVD